MKNHLGEEIKLPRNTILIGHDTSIRTFENNEALLVTDLDRATSGTHYSEYTELAKKIGRETGIYKTQNKELLEYLSQEIKSDIVYIRVEEYRGKLQLVDYSQEQFRRALENDSQVRG